MRTRDVCHDKAHFDGGEVMRSGNRIGTGEVRGWMCEPPFV